jgi:hypothetical protein
MLVITAALRRHDGGPWDPSLESWLLILQWCGCIHIPRAIVAYIQSSYGMAHENDGTCNLSLEQQLIKLVCDMIRVLWRRQRIAPAEPSAIIGAHACGL